MKNKGFSLLEFLVALFILAVIILNSLFLLRVNSQLWFEGERQVTIQAEARSLFAFLDRRLSTAILPVEWEGDRPEFLGTATSLSFCGLISESAKETDLVWFQILFLPEKETIFVQEQKIREAERSFAPAVSPASRQPLAFGVVDLEFAYFDGTEFQTSWDSRKGAAQADQLPTAVRVQLRLASKKSREGRRSTEPFETIVELKNR